MVKRVLLILCGCAISLAICEGIVRVWYPHPFYEEPIIPNAQVGYIMNPHFEGRVSNMFGEFDTLLKTNSEGFRDRDHPIQKENGVVRIAFLGDSFTCGEQVEDEETFVRRIERSLNSQYQKKVECFNFGISGYDTQQEVLCYETFVRKYHPDLVVLVMYPRNDVMGNIFYERQANFGRPYYLIENGKLRNIPADEAKLKKNHQEVLKRHAPRWYKKFHIYNLFKHVRWSICNKAEKAEWTKNPKKGDEVWNEPWYDGFRYYLDPPDKVSQEARDVTRVLIQHLESIVKHDQAAFSIVACPTYSVLWPERWPQRVKNYPGLEAFHFDFGFTYKFMPTVVPELTRANLFFDLRPALRKADLEKSIFFKHDNHYNSWGHQQVAEALTPWIAKQIEGLPSQKN